MEEDDIATTNEAAPQEESNKTSHESLFGFLIMMIIAVLLVSLAAYGGWFLYHGVRENMSDMNQLSISDIPQVMNEEGNTPKETMSENTQKSELVVTQPAIVNKKIAIKVLNGGAVKGGAGVAADVLKGEGYTAVSTGNSVGDYSGVSVYFTAPATQGDADAVTGILLKKYPSSVTKGTGSGNPDTKSSGLTVIIGK